MAICADNIAFSHLLLNFFHRSDAGVVHRDIKIFKTGISVVKVHNPIRIWLATIHARDIVLSLLD